MINTNVVANNNNNVHGDWVKDISIFEYLQPSDLICVENHIILHKVMHHKKPSLQLGQSILSNKDIVYKLLNR